MSGRPLLTILRSRAAMLAVVPLALLIAACGSTATTTSSAVKLFMIPKFTGAAVFSEAHVGAQQMGKTWGYTVGYGGPSASASATAQVQFIDNAISEGYKGIFISSSDPSADTPALVKARQKGIAVVSFDSDVLPAGRSVYVQGTSAADIASIQLQMLGSQIGYSGDFAILSAQATDSNQVLWNKLLVQDLNTNPKYKNMHLVALVNPPNDGAPAAVQYAQNILKEYPNIKGIIAPTTIAVAAAAQVIQQQGVCSKYVVTGLGDPDQMKSYITSGCVKEVALWSFSREGQVAACTMHALLTKKITGKTGQTYSCPGGLGSFTVASGGVVTAGPPEVFSKSNLSAFTF